MDNIPEKEQSNEQRRGVAIFAAGIEKQVDNKDSSEIIKSKPIPFRGIGEVTMVLYRPTRNEDIDNECREGEKFFTVDLSGKITTGDARDLLKHGYYLVQLMMEYPRAPSYSLIEHQLLQVNLMAR